MLHFKILLLEKERHLSLELFEKNSEDSKTLKTDLSVQKQKILTPSVDNLPILIPFTFAGIIIGLVHVIAGVVVLYILFRPSIIQIEQNEVGIVYKKFGSTLPPNCQIALNKEMGIQIDILYPGRHFIFPFWMYKIIKEKAVDIGQDEIGLVKAKDGYPLAAGQMFGKVVECNDFQDGSAFIKEGGQRGIQLKILRNGIYRINTELFDVEKRLITHINEDEIGIVEAKDGQPLPSGKTFGSAVECSNFEDAQAFINKGGCRGKQLKVLTAGKYAINRELFKIKKCNIVEIEANQIGIVEAKDGQPLPLGQNFGSVVECNNFQDAEAFIRNGGQKGKQLEILSSGIYYINTELFKVDKAAVINISHGEIGLVIAQDGAPLPPGQILGKTVECNNFQNAEAFIRNGGQKGKQRTIITSGDYRINTELFTVITTTNAIDFGIDPDELKVYLVTPGKIGIITTQDGNPLPGGEIAGSVIEGHSKFQNVQKFIDAGGYRGLQEEVLEEGSWCLNPWFAKVDLVPLIYIKAGTVGVVISNVGENIEQDRRQDTDESRFNIVPQGYKGIEEIPLMAGKHSINTRIKNIEIVPSHEITLDWTNRDKPATNYDSNLKTLELRSKDGFTFKVEVTQVINIAPKNAPKMISRVGSPIADIFNEVEQKQESDDNPVKYSSIKNLVTRVLEPMVDNYFRNSAQEYDALDFLRQRDEIQEGATEHIKNALNTYGVQSVGTFINEIDLPNELEDRIKAQKIAEVESLKLKKEQETEKERRKLVTEQKLTESEGELVKAERATKIGEEKAKIQIREAQAQAQAKQLENNLEIEKKERETNLKIEEQERLIELEMKVFREKIKAFSPELYAKLISDKDWSEALSKFKYQAPEIFIGGGNTGSSGGMEALQSGQYQLMFLDFIQERLKETKTKRLKTNNMESKGLIEASLDQIEDNN